jgi:hypothetical protein
VSLIAAVFADLAGTGPLDGCSGCDGTWGDEDAARAAALGQMLPPFQVSVYDAAGRDLFERRLDIAGRAFVEVATGPLCGELPLRVEVLGGPEGWVACPASGGLTREVAEAGEARVAFPLFPAAGCPAPPATATATPEPVPTIEAALSTPATWPETGPPPSATPAAGQWAPPTSGARP